MQPSFIELSDGRRLAYCLSEGKTPTVMFLTGFKSDMSGSKALALEAYCKRHGQRFIRFDYTGHGLSSGQFEQGSIGDWKADALEVFDRLAGESVLLVGSSMGAWIGLLLALERPGKLAGFISVSGAPDFTEHLIWDKLGDKEKKALEQDGVFYAPSCYGEDPYPITRRLIEDGRNHLLLESKINIQCPVRLLQGSNDEDVPWQHAVRLMEQLKSDNVHLTMIKDAGHRLSEPEHLQLLTSTLEELLSITQ